jgi:hypothetical protein
MLKLTTLGNVLRDVIHRRTQALKGRNQCEINVIIR